MNRAGRAIVVAMFASSVATGDAFGAEVVISGADACVDASAVAEQASDLLGRPLGSVAGVDFEVALTRTSEGGWQLRLDTLDTLDGARRRRSRSLTAASCAELADLAAVGIAMSVRSLGDPTPPEGTPRPAQPADARPAATAAIVQHPPPLPPASVTFAGALALVADSGTLPSLGVGIELAGALRHRHLRVVLAGTAFAPQVAHTSGDNGGEFWLVQASAEACLPYLIARVTLLGCGGYEIGRISAEGVGVARPRVGSALWQAARAELGALLPLTARLALLVRGGGALPLSRPQFVLDGMTVHHPSRFVARLTLGAELGF